jgi:thioredoxin-like negative regulator of GroEL
MARALRSFYVTERIYPELLKLDRAIHAKANSAQSAAFLAETQLAMDQNEAAVQTLSALEPGKTTEMAQLLLGIAMARSGKNDEAKQIAEKVNLPKDAGPGVAYTAARLHAATGDSAKAMALLKACFEQTLPSQLDGFKSHAKTCSEFAAVAASSEFAGVMKTKSKLPESKCSGGSSCAGCPMSGKCPKSQGKQ